MLRLHNFWRSPASNRVRIALNLKGVEWEYVACNLRSGEHRSPEYLRLNPQGLVPALELGEGRVLTQSFAIIEYLDEVWPEPPLLPADAAGRARVCALALMIACEVHPLNNTSVLNHVRNTYGQDEASIGAWYRHWAVRTFEALEQRLAGEPETGRFCHGDAPGLADVCLAAQVQRNAQEGIDTAAWPAISRIHEACMALEAFDAARPERQPDAVQS